MSTIGIWYSVQEDEMLCPCKTLGLAYRTPRAVQMYTPGEGRAWCLDFAICLTCCVVGMSVYTVGVVVWVAVTRGLA